MISPRLKFSLLVLLFLGIAGNSAAEQRASGAKWAKLAQLEPGTEIRVTLSGGRTVSGHLQKATPDSLAINTTASQEMLLCAEIARVQLRCEAHRGRNTLIGLGIGAASGLVVGAALTRGHSPNLVADFLHKEGIAVFTPLGAIIGTAVGALMPTGGWHEIYRAT